MLKHHSKRRWEIGRLGPAWTHVDRCLILHFTWQHRSISLNIDGMYHIASQVPDAFRQYKTQATPGWSRTPQVASRRLETCSITSIMVTMIAPGTLQPSPQHYLTSSQFSYPIISYAHSRTWTLLVVKTLHQPKSCQTPRRRHQRGSAQHHEQRYIGIYQQWQYIRQNVV